VQDENELAKKQSSKEQTMMLGNPPNFKVSSD
jgi:hypothetical protein